jgi:hypothetical protein
MKKKGLRPKSIKIGGVQFTVKYYKHVPRDIKKELGEVAGWCDSANKTLGIVTKYSDPLTLFHEIGHAAADVVRATNALSNENFARPFFAIFFAALQDSGFIKAD